MDSGWRLHVVTPAHLPVQVPHQPPLWCFIGDADMTHLAGWHDIIALPYFA